VGKWRGVWDLNLYKCIIFKSNVSVVYLVSKSVLYAGLREISPLQLKIVHLSVCQDSSNIPRPETTAAIRRLYGATAKNSPPNMMKIAVL